MTVQRYWQNKSSGGCRPPVAVLRSGLKDGAGCPSWNVKSTTDGWRCGLRVALIATLRRLTVAGKWPCSVKRGLQVVNGSGEGLGRLEEMFSNGAHDVMRVVEKTASAQRVERLLPFIPTVVMNVDLAAGCIQVDWQRDW